MSELNEPIGSEAPTGVSRRTVTKAMAWAVPVIAVSAAVPAYAASQVAFTFNGLGCKLPGNSNSTYKGYAFQVQIKNTGTVAIVINIISIKLNGESLGSAALVNLGVDPLDPATIDANPITLAPGESIANGALLTSNAASSSNGTLEIKYTINGGVVQTVTKTVAAAPPINGASCSTFPKYDKVKLANVAGVIPVWTKSTHYDVGDVVQLSTGQFLTATTAGTSGTTEPVAPAIGGTVKDGDVLWTR
ncbi:hypothetical protein [Microbacterium sp. P5_E9]